MRTRNNEGGRVGVNQTRLRLSSLKCLRKHKALPF